MRNSLVHAFRGVRRERMSALLALLCLSVAIGTNTTVFSIVNGMILRNLPLDSPERLVSIQEQRSSRSGSDSPPPQRRRWSW